jgi:tetratricopeptide (TPR) repeat protein
VQKNGTHVVGYDASPLHMNIKNGIISYSMYLYKTFIPLKLAVLYPFPKYISMVNVTASAIFLGIVTAAVLLLKKNRKYLVVGWFWYLISLLPVIGVIVRVGNQSMADRYTYLPLIGIFIILVWGISEAGFIDKLGFRSRTYLVIAAFVPLTFLTWIQTGYWRTTFSLFSHTVKATENNWYGLGVLSDHYGTIGDTGKQYDYLSKALSINPTFVPGLHSMGILLTNRGQQDQALKTFQDILAIDPDNPSAHFQIGRLFAAKGDMGGALIKYNLLKGKNPELSQQLLNEILIKNSRAEPVH